MATVEKPRFAIVGAGSLGLVFAAALARAGHSVTLLARRGSATALQNAGHIEVSGQLTLGVAVASSPGRTGTVTVVGRAAGLPPVDVALFATKGQDLPQSITQVARTCPRDHLEGAFFAGVQNGVVKDELLVEAFGRARVVGAASVLGAERVSAGAVTVSGLGTTYFGEFDAATSRRAERAAAAFVSAGLPCLVVPDIRAVVWTKFCNAIGIFGVSALTGVPSREIFARRSLALAYWSLLEEAAAVAASEGAKVDNFEGLPIRSFLELAPEEAAAEMARRVGPRDDGPPGFSSMAQDLAAGRKTEIDETFGDLLRRARTHGLEVPRAQLVFRLVTGLELGPAGTGSRP